MNILIKKIHDYEPGLVKKIFDFVFVPCSEDQEGEHKYICAMPVPKTNTISEAFYGNKTLEWVIIDDSVETIGYAAFYRCNAVTDVFISESVKIIEKRAFVGMSKLTHIIIGNSVETIGQDAFPLNTKIIRETQ